MRVTLNYLITLIKCQHSPTVSFQVTQRMDILMNWLLPQHKQLETLKNQVQWVCYLVD